VEEEEGGGEEGGGAPDPPRLSGITRTLKKYRRTLSSDGWRVRWKKKCHMEPTCRKSNFP